MATMNPIHRLYWIAKGVGWDNVPRRLLQAFRLKSGRLRKRLDPERFTDEAFRAACPHDEANQRELWQTRAERFFPIVSAKKLSSLAEPADWQRRVVEPASKALAGEYPFFNHGVGELGWPPDFNLDPFHDLHWPTDRHWLETAHSGPPILRPMGRYLAGSGNQPKPVSPKVSDVDARARHSRITRTSRRRR